MDAVSWEFGIYHIYAACKLPGMDEHFVLQVHIACIFNMRASLPLRNDMHFVHNDAMN